MQSIAQSALGRPNYSFTSKRRRGIGFAWIGLISFVGLYIRLFSLGRYYVTAGGICAGIVFLLSVRKISVRPAPILIGAAFIIFPLIIFALSAYFRIYILPTGEQFLASYSLWFVSIVLICLAFTSRTPISGEYAYYANIIIIFISAVQVLCAALLHKYIGYDLVRPLTGVDVDRGYVQISLDFSARAIGLVYEPSMCGRVIGTLCFIDLMYSGKMTRNLVLAVLGILLTKSLGLLVLIVALGVILFARSVRGLSILGICLAIVSVSEGAIITARLKSPGSGRQTSSVYRRTIAPINTLEFSLQNYSFGIPIGSNEIISELSGYADLTGEEKITNGIYEFLMYFGVFGFVAILFFVASSIKQFLVGEREISAAILYLTLSTALSGSFLAIESSLLTYFFIVACLAGRARRLSTVRSHYIRFARKNVTP